MAAGIPKEKAVEFIEMYGQMLEAGIAINELDYRRGIRELEKEKTVNSVSALGILHAAAGKLDKAFQVYEDALANVDDSTIAANYIYILKYSLYAEKLRDKSFEFADKFPTKRFTSLAYSSAYCFGYRDLLIKYMDQHIKLLSEDEGRDLAERQKIELLTELDDAYSSTGCTPEQFKLLAEIVFRIAQEYSAITGFVEVSKNGNKCYIVDVSNKKPKTIARMNFSLAEAICSEHELDNCELIARFSAPRTLHTGGTYVNHRR